MPYLRMTAALMEQFGVKSNFQGTDIIIPAKAYKAAKYRVELTGLLPAIGLRFAALASDAQPLAWC